VAGALGEMGLRLRLQYRARVDSVTRELLDDLRERGVVGAAVGLATRFAANNRRAVSLLTRSALVGG